MSKERLITQLKAYSTPFAEESSFVPRFISLLNNFPNCFHRSLVSGHITGSAWVVSADMTQVVLLHHSKLNRWLQPGGHADGEEEIAKVVAKELQEETGLSNCKWINDGGIFDLDVHLIPERKHEKAHFHFDIRLAAIADTSQSLVGNSESKEVRWVSLDNITPANGFEQSILRMVEKTKKLKLGQ